jgi:transcription elongation factor Elf1
MAVKGDKYDMQYINNWQDKNLYCMFCGTDKSVKYFVTIRNQNGKDASVCCCNWCVLKYEEEALT